MIGGNKNEKPSATESTGTSGDMQSILGKGSEFEGKLKFEGTVRVEGRFKGEIRSNGTLIVGENAVVEGDVDVDSAIISGKIEGNITTKTRLELNAPAIVGGSVIAPVLIIEEGVSFDGSCQTSKGGSNEIPPMPKQLDIGKK